MASHLSDDLDCERYEENGFEFLGLKFPTVGNQMETFERLWGAVRSEIMESWTAKHPGTRPRA